jgi:hypothetical protein
LALGTLATFAFYQWTQPCTSWLTFFLSVSVLFFVLLTLAMTSFFVLRMAKRPGGPELLFSGDYAYVHRWGSLYSTLSKTQIPFAVVLWVIVLARSAVVCFGQKNGFVQVVVLVVVDIIVCLSECCP